MTKIALVAGGDVSGLDWAFDLYVGIDGGAMYLFKQGLPLDLAIGDFDSVSAEDLSHLRQAAKELIKVPREKDDTDTELAVKTIFKRYPKAHVTLFGALGGRLDHLLGNIFLPSHPTIAPFMEQLTICDCQNKITFLPGGQQTLSPDNRMAYIAFLVEGGSGFLEIKGAKYELTKDVIVDRRFYASNEFIQQPIVIKTDGDYVMVIESEDRR
ncbi:thiamine diphosphokinase [Streptococcus sp. zg-JUN1979]|uniref:thiamine diphosphokinase n=1 Tax=Streptococcus sp. zg-JUN1979 TaxID=3391450 RepID=UPI0039A43885